MKIYFKGLNACVMRDQKLLQYRQFFTQNGHKLVSIPSDADVIVVWTCSFRADYRDASYLKIQEYIKNYNAKVIITGCLPDIAPEMLNFDPDRVKIINWKDDNKKLANEFQPDKWPKEFWGVFIEEQLCEDAAVYRAKNPDMDATFHDQFIKLLVSEGCNFKCAYCSERLAFPPYRSFPVERLYESLKEMVEKTGVHEVILVSDSLGQYGCDIHTNLPTLIRKLKTIHPDMNFAFNNMHMHNFVEFIDDMKFFILNGYVKHFNLPIQSGSDHILKLMDRIYSKKDIEAVFELLQDLKFTEFDTHIIVGFPGEREEDVDETIELLLAYRPKYVLASKYMESINAPSSKLPDKVKDEIALKRLGRVEKYLTESGIICNCDGSEMSIERIIKLNRD